VRTLLLALALSFAPQAHAGPGNALFTLLGSVVGGVGGALIGPPIYGAIDPYGSDDGLEWVVIGVPMGFGVGAAVGGTLAHGLTFGGKTLRVGLVSGAVALGGATLVAVTPALYEDFADDRFQFAYVAGTALTIVGVPLAATLTSMFSFREPKPKHALAITFGPASVQVRGQW